MQQTRDVIVAAFAPDDTIYQEWLLGVPIDARDEDIIAQVAPELIQELDNIDQFITGDIGRVKFGIRDADPEHDAEIIAAYLAEKNMLN